MVDPEKLLLWVDAWLRDDDEDAAREIVNVLAPRVTAIVRHHLPPREAVEDLVQQVFVKMFQNLGSYRRELPLEHWVSRIATNTCIDHQRARRRRPEVRWTDLSAEQAETLGRTLRAPDAAEPDFAPAEARSLLERLMEVLTPAERLAFSLHHLEQRSLAEVQAISGQGGVALRVRLFRARRKLQRALRELDTFPS
jgi:RNA polymerase sigma-70 factor (ECF subfamily)